jgi:hypothetical protein
MKMKHDLNTDLIHPVQIFIIVELFYSLLAIQPAKGMKGGEDDGAV